MLMHFMAYLTPVDLCVATLTTEEAPRPIVFWTSRSAYLMPEKLFTLSGISTPGVEGGGGERTVVHHTGVSNDKKEESKGRGLPS